MAVTATEAALVSWAEYKAIYGIDDDEEIDRYQNLINMASARMELYCSRKLKARSYTGAAALYLDGFGKATAVAPHSPINSISSLNIDASRAFAAETVISPEKYCIRPGGIIELYSGVFPAGSRVAKLECNAGYAVGTSEIETLKSACLVFVKWMASRFAGGIGKRAETSADGMNVSWEIDIPLEVKTLLEQFRENAL